MTETIIRKAVKVHLSVVKFKITAEAQTPVCQEILKDLADAGWVFLRNVNSDVIGVQMPKDAVSPDDVKLFGRLARYVEENSCLSFIPEKAHKPAPIWWFFERGGLRESHWGLEL